MSIAYIALGANLDQPSKQIKEAICMLGTLPGSYVITSSSLYRSPPHGYQDQPDFVNAVTAISTSLKAGDLLTALLKLEQKFGRTRTFKNAPRTLDLDLLLYDNLVINTQHLTLPHPRMTERPFVMIPLQEIAPALIIAGQGSINEICQQLTAVQNTSMQLTKLDASNAA